MDSVTGKPVSIGKPEILEQILSEKNSRSVKAPAGETGRAARY